MFSSPNFGAANKPFGDFKVPDQGSNDQLVPYHDRGREREREKDEGGEGFRNADGINTPRERDPTDLIG